MFAENVNVNTKQSINNVFKIDTTMEVSHGSIVPLTPFPCYCKHQLLVQILEIFIRGFVQLPTAGINKRFLGH